MKTETKQVEIDLMPKGKKHWATNMADTLILLESEGWLIQEIFANSNISPIKAFVRLKLIRLKKEKPKKRGKP